MVLCGFIAAADVKPASKALELARQLNEAFVEVAESAQQSVVVIDVAAEQAQPDESELPPAMRRWLERYYGKSNPHQKEDDDDDDEDKKDAPPNYNEVACGVVLDEEGYIVTNCHVVENAKHMRVRLKDGRELEAEVRGTDRESDLAVIKLKEKPTGLKPAKFADSDKVRVGEFAVAIGAPYNLDYTVTVGHVSAKGRHALMRDRQFADEDFIQTDANINPGNSGGPLVNLDGEVIGINSMIRGLHTGIGFAIPANLTREISARLITDGKFVRSWLGVSIQPLREYQPLRDDMKGIKDGVVVTGIDPKGPASKSKLKPSDVIVAIEGKSVRDDGELRREVSRKTAGKSINLSIYRGGETMEVSVIPEPYVPKKAPTIAQKPEKKKPSLETLEASDTVGIDVKAFTSELAQEKGVEFTPGVVIVGVAEESLAAHKGLKAGDIVTDVNHQAVTNPDEFKEAVQGSKGRLLIKFIRDGVKQFEVLKDRSK
jgi:serine protease Do